jgi:hypothetical protein
MNGRHRHTPQADEIIFRNIILEAGAAPRDLPLLRVQSGFFLGVNTFYLMDSQIVTKGAV